MNPNFHIESDCPDCNFLEDASIARRDFLKLSGTAALTAAAPMAFANQAKPAKPKPAEAIVKELFGTLTPGQRAKVARPFDQGAGKNKIPTRLGMYNRALNNEKIGGIYTKAQQELIDRALRAICAGDEGYHKISRDGEFDNSGSQQGCGAHFFGDPTKGKFSWLFTGHHLTVRCDGNTIPGTAFGGPIYYGHIAGGYSEKNVYRFQTKAVQSVYDALDAKQRKAAVIAQGTPGEQAKSVKHRERPYPGIGIAELSPDQRAHVLKVMRACVAPFRKEDGDEVMDIVKANGGLEKINLAFYKDKKSTDEKIRWHFWRLEGPGFVWNYRVLGHVHCFVNIARV
ncbi:MAG: DUF3500 domain-containing protein [Verrucomicrobia subdivision 3 bacterium]|nr:DUF3500 domain-containing protein [Limisphaerales bacterium]